MKLIQIKIIHFGQLSNITFNLPEDENITSFFGPNEAGKSTTVAFIKQILFGFYLRTNKSAFFEEYQPLAQVSPMGGSLVFKDEAKNVYELERLWAKGDKTKKGILTVKKNSEIIDASLFFNKIQNIDSNFYTDSFIFNQDTLAQILSLKEQDLVEQIYYLGASQSTEFLKVRDKLEKQADQLFKKTGKKPPLNQLFSKKATLKGELAKISDEAQAYRDCQKQVANEKAQLEEVNQNMTAVRNKINQRKNLEQKLSTFKKVQDLQRELVDVNFNPQNYQLVQELDAKKQSLELNLKNITQQLDSLNQTDFALERGSQFVLQKAQVLDWQNEIQVCQNQQNQLNDQLNQLQEYYPKLEKIAKLSHEEINEIRKSYNSFEKKPQMPKLELNLFIGVVGLVLLFFAPLGTVLGALALIGLGVWNYQARNKLQDYQQVKRNFNSKFELGTTTSSEFESTLSQIATMQSLKVNIAANQNKLGLLQEKLTKFVAKLSDFLKQEIELDEIVTTLDELDLRIRKYEKEQAARNTLMANKTDLTAKLAKVSTELTQALAADKVENLVQYQQKYQKYLEAEKKASQLAAYRDAIKDDEQELKAIVADEAKFNHENTLLNEQELSLTQKSNQLNQALAETKLKLTNFANSSEVASKKQALADLDTQIETVSIDYLSNLLAAKIINRALDLASGERLPKMMQASQAYFNLLTQGRYKKINFEKNISVTNQNSKKIDIKYLSRATKEQLYFALKLAFAQQIHDEISLPILIDDSFVNFDDNRINEIKNLLIKLAKDSQILIFTARKTLSQNLPGNKLEYPERK